MTKKIVIKNILELDSVVNYQDVVSIKTSYWYDSKKKYQQLLAACVNLEELYFYHGAYIHELPTTVYSLTKLHTLVLKDCSLNTLTSSIAKLSSLRVLILNSLYLLKFPKGIGYLENLEELDLCNTKIKESIDVLEDLTALRHLNLIRTSLKAAHFPKELLELPNLKELFLPKAVLKDVLEKQPDLAKKIPYLFQHQPLEKKHVQSLLNILRREQYDWHLRVVFLNLLGDHYDKLKKIARLEDILAATDVPLLEVLRLKAFEYYEAHDGKKYAKSFGKNAHFTVVGKLKLKKKTLQQQLKAQGIKYSATITAKTTHLLLGQLSKKVYLEARSKNIPIITEQMVLDYINEHSEQYLVDDVKTAPEYAENIADLLLSGQHENLVLAMELFKQGGFSKSLLTELFIAYKETTNKSIEKEAAILLKQYGSVGLIDMVKKRNVLFPMYNGESSLSTQLRKFEKNTELDVLKIAWYGYRKHKKGINFLLKRLASEGKKELLSQLIENDVLDLSNKGLTSIPKEMYEFSQLQEVNLKYNRIATINLKLIKNLKNLKILNLIGNYPLWNKKNVFNSDGRQFSQHNDQQELLQGQLRALIPDLTIQFY